MDDTPLREVLILCQEVTNENKTGDLYSTVEVFLTRNYSKISKEAQKERSPKRKVYGKMERALVDYFMRLCKYACSRSNIQRVHRIMMMLGFSGYENETRFRQRTENTLKKWKKQGKRVPLARKRMSRSVEGSIRKSSHSARVSKPSVRSSNQKRSQKKDMEEVKPGSSLNENELLQQQKQSEEVCEPSDTLPRDCPSSPVSLNNMPLNNATDRFAFSYTTLFDRRDLFSTPVFGSWDMCEEFFPNFDREDDWTDFISDPSLG